MNHLTRSFYFVLMLFAATAWAQDEELYDPEPPPDSAFIRVINASESTAELDVEIANLQFHGMTYPEASNYRIIGQGQRAISVGDISQTFNIEAGNYYSVAIMNDQTINLLTDEISRNPAKCGVLFYNLSGQTSASLTVPSRSIDIIGNLASGAGKLREVNAIDIDMAVVAGDNTVTDYPTVQLKRRSHLSFILTGTGENLQSFMIENKTER